MAEKTIRQHYVPQFYLKNWNINKDTNYKPKVLVYDIQKDNSFSANIEDIASSNRFYDYEKFSDEEIDIIYENIPKSFQIPKDCFFEKQGIEKLIFADEIENKASQTIQSIIKKLEELKANHKENINKKNILSSTDKVILSYFISIQYTRTKKFRDKFQKLYNEIIEDINEKSKKTVEIELVDINENKLIHLRDMFYHANSIQKILLKYKWILYINFTKVHYITSDNPVVKKPNLKGVFGDYGLGAFGFNSKGIEIHFPLSPHYELIIHEPKYLKKLQGKKFEKINIKYSNIVNINESNAFQIQFSNYLFSINDDFDFIKKVIANKPELKSTSQIKKIIS